MRPCLLITICFALLVGAPVAFGSGFSHGFSIGAHYFTALGDIIDDPDFEEAGIGYNASYRLGLSRVFSVEAVLQSYPAGYYDAEEVYSPELYGILGRGIYGGAGILAYHIKWSENFKALHDDESEWTDLTYALIAGVEIPLVLETITLDINARYVFNNWHEVEEFDEDTVTLGAKLRLYLNR